jgi:hypothetical protein
MTLHSKPASQTTFALAFLSPDSFFVSVAAMLLCCDVDFLSVRKKGNLNGIAWDRKINCEIIETKIVSGLFSSNFKNEFKKKV